MKVNKKPLTHKVCFSIGLVTFKEVIRDKILYSSIMVGILLFGAGLLASKMSITRPERVVLDFGLTVVNITCGFIAILIGAWIINREYEKRTVFITLSKPIYKFQFLIGKLFGLTIVIASNWLLLCLIYLGILLLVGGSVSSTLIWALILLLFQSIILGTISVFFSTFSTTTLSIMFSIGIYLVGNNISKLRLVASKMESQFASEVFSWFSALLPNLEHFNLNREAKVTYGISIDFDLLRTSFVYAIILISAIILLSAVTMSKREI